MPNNEGNLLVTGKWGEPHVTSSQARNFNSGLVGPECYVFDGLTCTMTNSNTAHIDPGVACFNGSDVEVPPGGIDVPINNGTQGNKQNVVICFAYQKDANDQTEKVTAVALYGDPDPVSPQDPTIPEGKITDGGNGPYYMPLWRIVLDNVSVGEPEKLFIKIQSNAELQSSIDQVFLKVYPVGSIYMSVSSTSPATLFGGTWERIQDRFLLAAGSSYAAGSTGGAATHKLTTNEIPSHTHKVKWYNAGTSGSGDTAWDNGGKAWQPSTSGWDGKGGSKDGFVATATGGSKAHNNMPPYLAVYIWKRTA